jgi:hypothetical protein
MTQHLSSSERRRNRRVLFDAPVSLQTAGGENYESLLIDISLKGALAKIPENWHADEKELISLCIHLDDADAVINMQCHIVHTENNAVGFHCHSMDMDSIIHLRRLVELNLEDPNLLDRELAALG